MSRRGNVSYHGGKKSSYFFGCFPRSLPCEAQTVNRQRHGDQFPKTMHVTAF
jgi:hypothetical protein